MRSVYINLRMSEIFCNFALFFENQQLQESDAVVTHIKQTELIFMKNAKDGVTFLQFLYHIGKHGFSFDRHRTDTRGVA